MKIGFAVPVSGPWATPEIITEVAGRADELGYASLWTFQRLLYPEGTALSETYHSVLDPLVTLGFLASCTQRAKLGVAVVNFPFVSPILLAKQAAAIDVLSHGRLMLGLGLGWAEEEFTATGATTGRRGTRLREYVQCLDAIFSGTPDFAGEFYRVPKSEVLPRPVQQPRPPVLLGGVVPAALERAGRIADGWISSSRADLRTIGESAALVRGAAEEAGRDPASLQIIVRGLVRLTDEQSGERTPLTGSAEQIRADFVDLEAQGVDEVFVDLNFDPEFVASDADPAATLAQAHVVLESLAPVG
ncbi:MAG TPA: TIGR03619 family F420-dependent LLM class oxidoreductase [Frankiaceae bacterium]|jgi:probable F420-dependent oxidoreductase|nr:TIGR03619 family F420-dependent LLM class oxidoreductase [Frankiaceae bacterium]